MHHRHDIDIQAELELTRRSFFNTAASGVGGIALASLLQQDGLLAVPAALALVPVFLGSLGLRALTAKSTK